jgi:O-methyltransferase
MARMNRFIGRGINKLLRPARLKIERLRPAVESPIPPAAQDKMAELWREDSAFQAIRSKMQDRTLVPELDSFFLYQAARESLHLPGDVAEVGVYKGGTAYILARLFSESKKALHLFDTFAGMPETDSQRDWHKKGDFADTSLESVKAFLAEFANVAFHPGLFPEAAAGMEQSVFCFVHIDVDIYKSVMDCCEFFYPKTVAGGVMVFDDYGKPTCPGAQSALDEFFESRTEKPFYLPSGQCMVRKARQDLSGRPEI